MNRITFCSDFDCKQKGHCINEDNSCNDEQSCKLVKAYGQCSFCQKIFVCTKGKEMLKYAGND